MSERLSHRRSRFSKALLAASLLLSSGCGVIFKGNNEGLPRCLAEPLAPAASTLANKYPDKIATGKKIVIKKGYDGRVAKDPGELSAKIRTKILGGIVKVNNHISDNARDVGSGTIVENGKQERVVLTAAHVVGTSEITKLDVVDVKGHVSKVVGGCMMYETRGMFEDISKIDKKGAIPAHIDLAVLKLAEPDDIGTSTIPIAGYKLPRGSWNGTLANFQKDSPTPVIYNAVVAGELDGSRIQYLTGIADKKNCQPSPDIDGLSICAAQTGASGGGIFDRNTGELLSVSDTIVSPSGGQPYLTQTELKKAMNVIQSGDVTQTWPEAVQGPAYTIVNAILDSPLA